MNAADVKTAADLLVVLKGARDWKDAFEKSDKAFIFFGDENSDRSDIRGMESFEAWDGHIIVPRPIAIDMMQWLIDVTEGQLTRLGVELPKGKTA